MEKSAILTADVLDIIFEGRNKEYGAYELRRSYNKRLRTSVLVMLSVLLLLFVGQLFAGKSNKDIVMPLGPDVIINAAPPPVEEPPPPPPPATPPPPEQTKMIKFTPPVITNDEDVPEDEKPPVMEDIDAKIGTVNREGVVDNDIVAPPADDGSRGVIEPPRKPKEDSVFIKVEIESTYPGGLAKWQRFLQRNLDGNIPQVAIDNQISGTIMIQFIVDKEGNVSNVEAISGPEELRALGVNVIKKSGKWIPAIQNGEKVKSYKRQPITIQISEN